MVAPPSGCDDAADCPKQLGCSDAGPCATDSRVDASAADGGGCPDGACTDASIEGKGCSGDADCTAPFVCRGGLCIATTPPTAPSALSVSQTDSQILGLAFAPGSGASSHEEIHAPMLHRSSGYVSLGLWSEPAAISGNQIAGLSANTRYEVRIRARNSRGVSAWTTTSTGTTATTTSTVSGRECTPKTGDAYLDGVLDGRWTFSSSRKVLTFSFPTDPTFYDGAKLSYGSSTHFNDPATFSALPTDAQDAVRFWMFIYSMYVPIEFVERPETATDHADIRVARNSDSANVTGAFTFDLQSFLDVVSGSWTDGEAGDIWFNSTAAWGTPTYGSSYFWWGIGHELGHALGLPHSFEGAGFSDCSAKPVVPSDKDAIEYTIMSYRRSPGGAASPTGAAFYPTTPMQLDVRALQYMYGANYALNGSRSYSFSATTAQMSIAASGQDAVAWPEPGANVVYFTQWSPGTIDRIDLSTGGYVAGDATINLTPGATSIIKLAQRANLGGASASGNIYNAYEFGGSAVSDVESSTVP
jgi:serralysin